MNNFAAQSAKRPPVIYLIVGLLFLSWMMSGIAPPAPPSPHPRLDRIRVRIRNLVIIVAKVAPAVLMVLPFVLGEPVVPDPPEDKTLAPSDAGILYEMRSQAGEEGVGGPPTAELNHGAGW